MKIGRKLRSDYGSQIAEAAVVLPLVFMILMGIYWFGRAYNIYATVTHAAREGARVAVVNTCSTCSTPDQAPTADEIADKVADSLRASKLDPTQVTQITPAYCRCGNVSCIPVACETGVSAGKPQICVQRQVQLAQTTDLASCGTAVSFQYPYQFYLPFSSLNLQLINLKAQSQVSGEQ